MRQRFLLDHRLAGVYLAGWILTACHPGLKPLAPVGLVPATEAQVDSWVQATRPVGHTIVEFKWLFHDERGSAGGIGKVRIAPPDTLRFDARGPLGSGRMAAVVVGDSALWARPEDAVGNLLPNYPLMWALFGVARLPDSAAGLRGLDDGAVTVWEYSRAADTLIYIRSRGTPDRLQAEVRHAGRVVGRAETKFSGGDPVSARLTVPAESAVLDLTFVRTTPSPDFPPDTWSPPQP